MAPRPRVLYWFRVDLRLHDSPALQAALDLDPECLYPIWCWDPHYVYRARVGPNRWQYLLDCQKDLSASITKLNPKSKLFVLREGPNTILPKIFKAWRISHLVFEKDTDAYGRDRDLQIAALADHAGVQLITRVGRTLWDPDELVRRNGGKSTMSMAQLRKAAAPLGPPPRPLDPPSSLPDPGDTALDHIPDRPSDQPDLNDIQRNRSDRSYLKLAGPRDDFAPPDYAELGLKPATTTIRGGETRALDTVANLLTRDTYIATFSKPDTAPTALEPATTLLSPHFHFGSLSVRLFYWRVLDLVADYKKAKRTPPPSTLPTNLEGQLLFRDMYFAAQAPLGYLFSQTAGNPRARFIPWHLPTVIDPATGLATAAYRIDSALHEIWFQRWRLGLTGFPWIDALMRQLRREGWIHHLGRHAVACFLTRGGCGIDWERGATVFEEWLLDHEVSCNAGNWQWLSCTAFFAQFFRCYSPVAFPRKTDPAGDFVRRYVPELTHYPPNYIYEPHRAPLADQKKWGCLVKGDHTTATYSFAHPAPAPAPAPASGHLHLYPKPIFDFPTQRDICMQTLKEAYRVGLHGDDPRLADGSWLALFGADTGARENAGQLPTQRANRPLLGEEDEDDTPRRQHENEGLDQDQHEDDDGLAGERDGGASADGTELDPHQDRDDDDDYKERESTPDRRNKLEKAAIGPGSTDKVDGKTEHEANTLDDGKAKGKTTGKTTGKRQRVPSSPDPVPTQSSPTTQRTKVAKLAKATKATKTRDGTLDRHLTRSGRNIGEGT